MSSTACRRGEMKAVYRLLFLLAGFASFAVTPTRATTVIPVTDRELYLRSDVIVHGVISSSEVTVDDQGRPEMLTVIEPLAVIKGRLSGSLVLHQLGGVLPDGRFLQIWGRPEYVPGREVIVFASRRPEGEYQTTEMMLGKFEVWQDDVGTRFAIPDLANGVHPGVEILDPLLDSRAEGWDPSKHHILGSAEAETFENAAHPRELNQYLAALRSGAKQVPLATPAGKLHPVDRPWVLAHPTPLWGNIGNSRRRWNNGASAVWSTVNTANITGGGIAEATGALAAWTNDPNSNVNYTVGTGSSNTIDLNATSVCGYTGCLSGGGVIGCGGPSGGGSHTWRGDTYFTITGGFAQLRSYCTFNLYDSITTQSVITHELGHTLGLGHSDQNFSPHDLCSGDEGPAIMRSVVQYRTTLGTDDQDAIRWIYGDGGNTCGAAGAKGDFDGDGKADILLRNSATGQNSLWIMNRTTYSSTLDLPGLPNPNWQIAGVADFNGDGKPDILWRNSSTGQNAIWLMNGAAFVSVIDLPALTNLSYRIEGTGDLNGDGKPDILWRNPTTGANAVWLMNGTSYSSTVDLPILPGAGWRLEGTADFNGDGKPDVLARNYSTGQNAIWLMNGTTYSGTLDLPLLADTNYQFGGVADYDGDGKPDIVLRNSFTGQNAVWLLNGASLSSVVDLPGLTGSSWQIVGPK